MHPARRFLAPLMIVAAKMQNAVDQEYGQLFVQRSFAPFGLTSRRRQSNHDVTKQVDRGMGRLPHGKGQHIGRAILASIPTIETPHPLISYEKDAQLCRRFTDIGQNRTCHLIQMRLVKRHTSNITLQMDRH